MDQASNRGSPVTPPGFETVNVAAAPGHGYATGEELRGIRVDGQPLAAEANARATRAPVRHPAPIVDRQEDMFTMLSEYDGDVGRIEDRDRKQRQPPQQPRQQQQQQRPYQPRQRLQSDRRFDPLPMTYAELLPELLRLGFVELRTMAPPTVLPPGYDANVRCDFHSGAPGHNIKKCRAFQHKVQDLIDAKTINFAPVPNVVNNPMPVHGAHRVNCIEGVDSEDLVVDVSEIQTSLMVVKGRLLNGGVHPGCGKDCLGCAESENGCELLRAGIQGLMDRGCVQFGRAENRERGVVSTVTIFFKPSEGRAPTTNGNPVTISAPVATNTPTTIIAPIRRTVNSNVVPWRYDNAYRSNRRAENRVKPSNQVPVTISVPVSKAPAVVSPAVDNEISVNQLEGVIANVSTRHGVGFTDLDLTPEGRNHNKALHITMECKGAVLSHVLVDTGSSLNVLPKQILKKISIEGVVLTPSDLIVRAFDGSKRSVFGEVKEDVYNEVDFQLVMLAKIKALSKQIATSTRVPKNANLVIALQYDLRGKAHANDHCVPEGYVEQTHCVGNYQDSDSYFDIDNPW
ncbi:uncharacterized protein LOC127130967 [Lathyrus oleraceus]|uniref:uncharacterized protein LOC127130967 n=1 Tax=Pisum sativum TaxID=3888 RepID=UPI0021D16DC2|nr:uncharacterized protein LOC127130967 [Pisum sativum]